MSRCEGCGTRALPDDEDLCDTCQPDMAAHISQDRVDAALALLGLLDRYSVRDNETGNWIA